MSMHIWQPSLSHTVRKEIDPLEWAEIVGNLGGAWGEREIEQHRRAFSQRGGGKSGMSDIA